MEDVKQLKEAVYGNGHRGLLRDVDSLHGDVKRLQVDFDRLDRKIERVLGWALTSSISALVFIIFQLAMLVMKKIAP